MAENIKYEIQASTLEGIADAIREVKGTTGKIKTEDFRDEILDMSSGSGPYCWKKFSTATDSEGNTIAGEFVEYIVSDTEGEYPENGVHADGYWYELNSLEAIANTEGMYCWAKFTEKPELPVGYTPLESLALTGSNYFILDYVVTTANFAKLKVVADIAITGTSSNNYRIDGCAAANGQFYFGIASNGQYGYSVRSDSTTGVTANTARHTHTLDVPNKKYTVDSIVNITTNPNTSQTINKPFVVGGYFDTNYSNVHITHGKTIWKYEFYENDVLVRKYTPVLDANGIACIHDKVNSVNIYASGTGDIVSGSAGNKVAADAYVLSDNLNTYPQDGYHTDGFYYKLMGNDIAWDERGQYAWSKNETVYADGEVSFPTIASATLTATTDGYTLKSGSSGGWGYTYLNSDPIDTTVNPITLNYTIASTGIQKGIFIGVANTKTTTYSTLDHSIYLSTGATNICHWRNGSQINAYETTTTNDVITMTVNGTLMSVYKNDKLIFTDTLAFTNAYVCIVLYTANTVYGVIDCKMANIPSYTPIGYVIGNEEDAYPNEDFADDGYWYQKVGATKVTPKYASGTVTTGTVNSTVGYISVSGLGFRPYAIQGFYSTQGIFYAVCDSNGNLLTAKYRVSSNNITDATSTFSVTDDGFSGRVGNTTGAVYTWYAIGY